MNAPRHSPAEIRAVVERLTGAVPVGTVSFHADPDPAWWVRTDRGPMEIRPVGEDWAVFLAEDAGRESGGVPSIIWTTSLHDPTLAANPRVLEYFYAEEHGPLDARFVVTQIETATDIQRKRYASAIGPIVMHSRRHPEGTEIVLQAFEHPPLIRFIWERATGKITRVDHPETLPF